MLRIIIIHIYARAVVTDKINLGDNSAQHIHIFYMMRCHVGGGGRSTRVDDDFSMRIVTQWLSRDHRRLLVFCGSDTTGVRSSGPQLMELSMPVSGAALRNAFGVSAATAMHMAREISLKAHGASRALLVPVQMRPDDSLADVRKKVAAAVGLTDDRQVHMWAEWFVSGGRDSGGLEESNNIKSNLETELLAQEIAEQAFRGRNLITKSELAAYVARVQPPIQVAAKPRRAKAQAKAKAEVHDAAEHHDLDEVVTKWQAVGWLQRRLLADAGVPLSKALDYRLALDAYEVSIPASPFQDTVEVDNNMAMGDGTPRHVYTLIRMDGLTLQTAAKPGAHLHVCTAHHVMAHVRDVVQPWNPNSERLYINGFLRLYFPALASSQVEYPKLLSPSNAAQERISRIVHRDDTVALARRVAADMGRGARKDGMHFETEASPLSYIQVRGNERTCNAMVDLRDVFTSFPVTSEVPMLIFFDGDTTFYKISAAELREGRISEGKVASWIQRRPLQRADEPYLQFIVAIPATTGPTSGPKGQTKPGRFSKLILWDDLAFEYRQTFTALHAASLRTDAVASMSHIDRTCLRVIRSMFSGRPLYLPTIDPAFLDRHPTETNLRVSNAVFTMVLQSASRMPSLGAIERAATKVLYAHFFVVHRSPVVLILSYRRCDTSTKQQTVEEALAGMQEGETTEAMIQRLMDAFGMTQDEAATQVEDFLMNSSLGGELGGPGGLRRSGRRMLARMQQLARPIMVRIFAPDRNMGCKVMLEGLTSEGLLHKCRDAVTALAAVAAGTIAVDVPIRQQPARDVDNISDQVESEAKALQDDSDLSELLESELSSMLPPTGHGNNNSNNNDNDNNNNNDDGRNYNNKKKDGRHGAMKPDNGQLGIDNDNNDVQGASVNKFILNRLYRADPDLFQAKLSDGSRYSSVCGKVDARQPIVISPEEKAIIDRKSPGSYNGFVQVGSTDARAARNIYICPHVWCPKSRLSMSKEQFEKNGRRCPDKAVDEEPIIMDAKYWKGTPKYPGFHEGTRHPQGLCMPCCFRRPNHNADVCGVRQGVPGGLDKQALARAAKSASSGPLPGAAAAAQSTARYIRGDTVPLGRDVFGLLPLEAHKFLGNRKCGNRDDGSGQIVATTNCYIRKGVSSNSVQPFLTALAFVLELAGGPGEVAHKVGQALSMPGFMAMAGGALCREFMPSHPDLDDNVKLQLFAAWLRSQREYVSEWGLQAVASVVANAAAQRALPEALAGSPEACREYMLFCAMERFKDYLADRNIVKSHYGLVDLFNTAPAQLNPAAYNMIILERDLANGRVYGHGQGGSGFRLDRPFVFLIKSGAYYEPMYRVHMDKGRMRSTMLFSYEGSPALRTVIDHLEVSRAGANDVAAKTASSWGSLLQILRAVGHEADTQVVDYRFRAVALVTRSGLAVPLRASEAILVHPTLTRMMYVSDLWRLKPRISVAGARDLFAHLAHLTSREDMEPRPESHGPAMLVLRSGFVVPLAMHNAGDAGIIRHVSSSSSSGTYLENLNILVGTTVPDARSKYARELQLNREALSRAVQAVTAGLQTNSGAISEYKFLRSSFNPFSLDYRRAKMYDMAVSLLHASNQYTGPDQKRAQADILPRLTDFLMLGPDVLDTMATVGISKPLERQKASEYVLLSDVDITQGAIEAAITRALRSQAGQQGTSLESLAVKAVEETTQLNNRLFLRELRARPGGEVGPDEGSAATNRGLKRAAANRGAAARIIRSFLLRSRRAPWVHLEGVDAYAVLSVLVKLRHPGTHMGPRTLKQMVANSLIGSSPPLGFGTLPPAVRSAVDKRSLALLESSSRARLHHIMSSSYRPGVYDVSVLSGLLALNVVVIDVSDKGHIAIHNFLDHARQDHPSSEEGGRARCAVLIHTSRGGFDILLNRQRQHLLTFAMDRELPEMERMFRESSKKHVQEHDATRGVSSRRQIARQHQQQQRSRKGVKQI
jgi:hypothetical protein